MSLLPIGRWSPARILTALLLDARTVADAGWIALYFVARQRLPGGLRLSWLAPAPRMLAFRSTPTRLFASAEAGGVSVWYEIVLQHEYAPLPSLEPQPGWTVVDVGANIGIFSVWANNEMNGIGRVLAIEPNPVSFRHLERSLAQLHAATAVAAGCSDSDGQGLLHFEPGYTVSGSLDSFDAATETVSIPLRRLDAILDEQGIRHVDLLKIDVEGAEAAVLRGATASLDHVDRVVVETTDDRTGHEVRELLLDRGFDLVHEELKHWGVPGLQLLAFKRREPLD